MIIIKHWPALQVILPMISSIFSILSFNGKIAWFISLIFAFILLSLSVFAFTISPGYRYVFGDWVAPLGIEYSFNLFSQSLIIYVNFILLCFICNRNFIFENIVSYIIPRRQNLFFALLFFAHSGYIGIVSSSDLFNLYVFIEISSLAVYVLIAQGQNHKSLIGAFDYLILGSIGATLILIGIGFLFSYTGSLNISDISSIISNVSYSRIVIVGLLFFFTGATLKIAFFPMQFWMLRAYTSTDSFLLTYISSVATGVGLFIFIKILEIVKFADFSYYYLGIIKYIVLVLSIFSGFIALNSKKILNLIIYSSLVHLGYSLFLLIIQVNWSFILFFIITDGFSKIGVFYFLSYIRSYQNIELDMSHFKKIDHSYLFKTLSSIVLIFSSGLPLSNMFFFKIFFLENLLLRHLYIDFILILLSFGISFLYYVKLLKIIAFSSSHNGSFEVKKPLMGLINIIIIQIIMLLFIGTIFNQFD